VVTPVGSVLLTFMTFLCTGPVAYVNILAMDSLNTTSGKAHALTISGMKHTVSGEIECPKRLRAI
jgi:hypothetical protein